MTSTSGIE